MILRDSVVKGNKATDGNGGGVEVETFAFLDIRVGIDYAVGRNAPVRIVAQFPLVLLPSFRDPHLSRTQLRVKAIRCLSRVMGLVFLAAITQRRPSPCRMQMRESSLQMEIQRASTRRS